MNIYIRLEDAVEIFAEYLDFLPVDMDGRRYTAKKLLKDARAIDAAEVVRCRDCIHNGSVDTDCPFGWKDRKFNMPKPDDFCSYGEHGMNGESDE